LQDKYAVLIFRETGLGNDGHIAFSKQLGNKLEVNPFFYGRENDRVGEPLLFDVGESVKQHTHDNYTLTANSIELDGSLVKPESRRWHHSTGNALWHTVSMKYDTMSVRRH
jgi:alpha-ketoglutarate-dependent 2,4-dichlorophenoxyacetate dioxygenase